MTLQTKLVISFTVLLLVVIATVGIVASRSIENILVTQTDRTLLNVGMRIPRPEPDFRVPEPPDGARELGEMDAPGAPNTVEERDVFLRPFAELLVGPDGTVILSEPSGFGSR